MAMYFFTRILRDDPEPRLDAGQRRLDVEICLDAIFVGKNAAHRRGGKDVAEYAGTHSNGAHFSAFQGVAGRIERLRYKMRALRSIPGLRSRARTVAKTTRIEPPPGR